MEAVITLKDVWKSATTRLGEPSAIIVLIVMMQLLSVASSDSLEEVSLMIYKSRSPVSDSILSCIDAVAATGAAFGPGTGTVLLNALQCYGNETNLTQCAGADFGTAPCPHSRDAGVTCQIRQCKIVKFHVSKRH